jgi:hypothetical protein
MIKMALETKTYAAASCSWIDPAVGLPEVDVTPLTGDSVSRSFLVGNFGFRFSNFTEAWVTGDFSRGSIAGYGFSAASGIYRGPSFAHIPSHAFSPMREMFLEDDAVRFTQIVGARTVSPEVVGAGGGLAVGAVAGAIVGSFVPVIGTAIGAVAGGVIGGLSGETVSHNWKGFPPIWSKIQIRIYRNGAIEAQLLQHSLFPSLTYYAQVPGSAAQQSAAFTRVDNAPGSRYYNATKAAQLPDWLAKGWGNLQTRPTPGPCGGNPWGIRVGVTGGAEIVPN